MTTKEVIDNLKMWIKVAGNGDLEQFQIIDKDIESMKILHGDYTGYEKLFPKEYRIGGHRWATEEIFEEVKSAIQQIQEMEKSEK